MEPDWMGKAPDDNCCDSGCDDCVLDDRSDYYHDQRIEREIENEHS